jgi:hypothetical protein
MILVLVHMNSVNTLRGFSRILLERLRKFVKNPSHVIEKARIARLI